MKRIVATLVPNSRNYPKKNLFSFAEQMLINITDDPDLPKRIISCYESWSYCCGIVIKPQSSQRKSNAELKSISNQFLRL